MAPLYILRHDISLLNTRSAIRVRLVHTYDIPEHKGIEIIKCKECVFHDEDVYTI